MPTNGVTMHRLGYAALLLTLTACASGPHVYADEQPEGLPKSARAHCRSWADELRAKGGSISEKGAICLDALLRADCADEMAKHATDLEEAGKGQDAFFYRFPGAWEPADVHQEVMEIVNSACLPNGIAMMQALDALERYRRAYGGRIPWASFGAPKPGGGMCRTGCK